MDIDLREIEEVINRAAKALQAEEKFPIAILAVRAERAAQSNPQDAPLVTAANVLAKLAESKTFISRSDLNKLYDKLYSRQTRFGEIFAEELGRAPLPEPVRLNRDFDQDDLSHDYSVVADPILSNALSGLFEGNGEYKLYSNAMAVKAQKVCRAELESIGMPPKRIEIFAGQSDMIVCQASYETPKGQAHVLVPVELNEDKALLPSMFLSRAGFEDLEAKSLSKHIFSTAGQSFKVDGEKLLEALSFAKNGVREAADEVEMAAMAMNAASDTPAYSPNGILYQKVDDEDQEVSEMVFERTAEEESFAKTLESPLGFAKQMFGSAIVENGRNMIKRALAGFGFGNVQVSVADVEEDAIHYAAAVGNKAGLKIPARVINSMVYMPEVAFANGEVDSFSAEGIGRLVESGVDARMMAVASPMYALKAEELMEQVREAIASGNLEKAEDAINVLGEVDVAAQKRAMGLIMESFNPDTLKKVASEQAGCSKMIKNSTSQHMICSHLNMPIHKVFQDKHGNCKPLYRKGEEASEGAMFMNAKVFGF